jgi:hypothetical protein
MKTRFQFAAVLCFGLAAVIGCSAADEVKDEIDCQQVCKRYSECFNSDYDVDACQDKCENNAGSDDDKRAKLRSCDDCIDDKSCTDATFNCATECAGIVP